MHAERDIEFGHIRHVCRRERLVQNDRDIVLRERHGSAAGKSAQRVHSQPLQDIAVAPFKDRFREEISQRRSKPQMARARTARHDFAQFNLSYHSGIDRSARSRRLIEAR